MGGCTIRVEDRSVKIYSLGQRVGPRTPYELISIEQQWTDDELPHLYRTEARAGQLSPETASHLRNYWARGPRSQDGSHWPQLSVQLLQTCRQIHWEAALVPFHDNTLIIRPAGGGSALEPCTSRLFLDKLNPAQRTAIHKLGLITAWPGGAPLTKGFAALCPNVADLTAFVVCLSYHEGRSTAELLEHLEALRRWPICRARTIICPGYGVSTGQLLPLVRPVLMKLVLGTAEAVDVALRRSLEDYEKELAEAREAKEDVERAKRKQVVMARNLRPRK